MIHLFEPCQMPLLLFCTQGELQLLLVVIDAFPTGERRGVAHVGGVGDVTRLIEREHVPVGLVVEPQGVAVLVVQDEIVTRGASAERDTADEPAHADAAVHAKVGDEV